MTPTPGAIVCNISEIRVAGSDEKGIARIDLFLDDSLIQTVDDTICIHNWNTRLFSDNSKHSITARALDLEGNEGFSDTVVITVFNNLDSTEIFIWIYDQHDMFYDSIIQDSIDCGYDIERALTANGHEYDRTSFLPPDLRSYRIGFITLGWDRC